MRFLAKSDYPWKGVTSAVLLGGLFAGWFVHGPSGRCQVHAPGAWVEMEFESGQGMAPKWAVQSVWLDQGFDTTELRLRLENATKHYLDDSYFYAEVFDEHRRLCFSALFRLRDNRELERGPLKPGGERTLESTSVNLATIRNPSTIVVYPAQRHGVRSGEVFTARVPIRIPVRMRATGTPWPIPDWARLTFVPATDRNDAPFVDLAFGVADVDAVGHLTAMRVLNARSEGVRTWVEKLASRLRFSPSMQDFVPRSGQAPILVRAGPLRPFRQGDALFDPEESPWVRTFVSSVEGNEIPPISLIILDPCRDVNPTAGGAVTPGHTTPGCFQYEATGTDWSLEAWKPLFPP